MISTAEVNGINQFTISCINGERSPGQVELDIKRDNKILIFPKKPNFKVSKPRNNEMVTMINNFGGGVFRRHTTTNFIPTHLTLTANKGETVHLSMELHSTQKRDVTWKYNGKFTQFKAGNLTSSIYSASYVGDSPLQGAWMRLIVRGLLNSHIHTEGQIAPRLLQPALANWLHSPLWCFERQVEA
uniref:Tyrosine kinase with immunoglobulin-like and EGF-like domains 1 n=1 Tax=Seriola dumerili TaxID=41447 RepID=A0A3B4UK89_SERDU